MVKQSTARGAAIAPRLTISTSAHAVLTPFRKRALRMMFDAAVETGGAKLTQAEVDVWSADDPSLDLSLVVEGSWDDSVEVREAVLSVIAARSSSWSEEERQDFGRMLHFSVSPTRI